MHEKTNTLKINAEVKKQLKIIRLEMIAEATNSLNPRYSEDFENIISD